MGFKQNKGGRYVDEVIIGGNVYSVSKLKSKARAATMRLWASILVTMLVAMMVVPYLAQAASNSDNSDAFNGTVIPGYSKGGLSIAAYGVDINSWGKREGSATMSKSNYGVWSENRVSSVSGVDEDATTITSDEKSAGWQQITGRQNYSATNPNGQMVSSTANDVVNPYRTQSDSTYWDAQTPSTSATEAGITVSLLPEFVIVGKRNGKACVLTNPDDSTSQSSTTAQSMILTDTSVGATPTEDSTAIPYYIPLNKIFDAYGLTKSSDTMTDLINAVNDDKSKLDGLLNDGNNLLYGTSYSDLNGKSGETSEAFNPYPYSMVFSKTDNGKQVVSSIYENCEAYVYFSPQSVYNAYVTLEKEYEGIVSGQQSTLDDQDNQNGALVIQLGYYQAAMAICEAYLTEALPQDMTRGYVGPVEDQSVSGDTSSRNGGDWRSNGTTLSSLGIDSSTSNGFQSYIFATLLYDVANQISSGGEDYALSQTNATMDTLSTFGYNIGRGDTGTGLKTGVMRGMNAGEVYNRMNAFTAYTESDGNTDNTTKYMHTNGDFVTAQETTGIYIAPYFPIQQHAIPQSERDYRFTIVNDIPFQTVKAYLSAYGFGFGKTNLSYSSGQFSARDNGGKYASLPTDDEIQQLNSLISMFQEDKNDTGNSSKQLFNSDDPNNNSDDPNNSGYSREGSAVLNPSKNKPSSGSSNASDNGTEGESESSDSTSETETTDDATTGLNVQQRVDQALINYSNSSMTADNVHDLCDVIRSINGLKYETFMRFYNPLKATGADPDVYMARVSPANTTYMPSLLTQGYSAAGGKEEITNGTERTDTAAYDYFSIPSFAPCFAQHTASDCYYGSLNYELRAFLQMGFLKTVNTDSSSGGINIPAVEAAEAVSEKANELASKEVIDAEKMKTNLSTIFSAAQILAIDQAMTDVQSGSTTLGDLRNYVRDGLNRAKGEYDFASQQGYSSSWMDGGAFNQGGDFDSYARIGQAVDQNSSSLISALDDSTKISFKKTNDWHVFSFGKYVFDSNRAVNIFNFVGSTNGDVVTNFDAYNEDVGIDYKNLDESIPFSRAYKSELLDMLDTGGKYNWCSLTDLMKKTDKYCYFDAPETVDRGIFSDVAEGAEANQGKAEEDMEDACANLFQEVNNFYNSLNGLSSAMPSQMQNAIAWANYANSSNSQNAYQADPSESTTTVIVNGTSSKNNSDAKVTNIATAKSMSVDMNSEGALVGTSTSSGTTSMQSKTKRGVEGTTSTATGNPASYTTTAIVARSQAMSRANSSYPYSGLASSALIQGADRYAQMQSQVIDYTNIANGLDNDLSQFKETEAVNLDLDLTAGEFNLLDFDFWGKLQEFFSNMSAGIVKATGNLFKSLMFPDDTTSSVSFAGVDTSEASADAISNTTQAMFMPRNSYAAAVSVSSPNMTRSGVIRTSEYNGSAPSYSISTASAADTDDDSNDVILGNVGSTSQHFILETDVGKNVYAFLQSVALIFVLISLIIIAFQNMLVYQNGDSTDFIRAQSTLKAVFPRAVVAVFMIGLPPIGGGVGFQGGGFLLLEAINSIVRSIASVFSTIEGTGIVDMTIKGFSTAGGSFFARLLTFLIALIVGLMYLIGSALVFFINLFLFLFFLLTPLAWGLYVWPFQAQEIDGENITGTIFSRITRRLGSKTFTGAKVGTEAAKGFVSTFVDAEALFVIYTLLLWFASYVFVGTAGDEWLSDTTRVSNWGDVGAMLWLAILNGVVIYIMYKLLMEEFRNSNAVAGMRGIANGIVDGVKAGASVATSGASLAKDVAGNLGRGIVDTVAQRHGLEPIATNANVAMHNASTSAPSLGETTSGNDGNDGAAGVDTKADAAAALDANADKLALDATDKADMDAKEEKADGEALPGKKTEDGATLVHVDNLDEKPDEPKTLGGRLKDIGRGLLDGDSAAVSTAMGGIAGMALDRAHDKAAANAYKLGAGVVGTIGAISDNGKKETAARAVHRTVNALGRTVDKAENLAPARAVRNTAAAMGQLGAGIGTALNYETSKKDKFSKRVGETLLAGYGGAQGRKMAQSARMSDRNRREAVDTQRAQLASALDAENNRHDKKVSELNGHVDEIADEYITAGKLDAAARETQSPAAASVLTARAQDVAGNADKALEQVQQSLDKENDKHDAVVQKGQERKAQIDGLDRGGARFLHMDDAKRQADSLGGAAGAGYSRAYEEKISDIDERSRKKANGRFSQFNENRHATDVAVREQHAVRDANIARNQGVIDQQRAERVQQRQDALQHHAQTVARQNELDRQFEHGGTRHDNAFIGGVVDAQGEALGMLDSDSTKDHTGTYPYRPATSTKQKPKQGKKGRISVKKNQTGKGGNSKGGNGDSLDKNK